MAAQEQGLDVLDGAADFHGDEGAVAGDVEAARLADDAAGGEAGGFPGGVDHRVERVGDDDDHGVRGEFLDILGDAFDDLDVGGDQVVPAHAGLAGEPAVMTTTSEPWMSW